MYNLYSHSPQAVNWLPLDRAADAIIDFRKASSPETHTVHLAHSHPVAWHVLAAAASDALAVPLVPYDVWLEKLEATATDGKPHVLEWLPILRRLAQRGGPGGRMAFGFTDMVTTLAIEASPTLADADLRQLNGEDMSHWVASWRNVGSC